MKTLINREELNALPKPELNIFLGGKYQPKELKYITKSQLVEEIVNPPKGPRSDKGIFGQRGIKKLQIERMKEGWCTLHEITEAALKLYPKKDFGTVLRRLQINLKQIKEHGYKVEMTKHYLIKERKFRITN